MGIGLLGMDHLQRPRFRGPLLDATHTGSDGTPGEGPYVQLWLAIDDGIIRDAAFQTHGCPSSIAAASVLCQLCIGRLLGLGQYREAKPHLLFGLDAGLAFSAHALFGAALERDDFRTAAEVLALMARREGRSLAWCEMFVALAEARGEPSDQALAEEAQRHPSEPFPILLLARRCLARGEEGLAWEHLKLVDRLGIASASPKAPSS